MQLSEGPGRRQAAARPVNYTSYYCLLPVACTGVYLRIKIICERSVAVIAAFQHAK
jgi:hypothetical protein